MGDGFAKQNPRKRVHCLTFGHEDDADGWRASSNPFPASSEAMEEQESALHDQFGLVSVTDALQGQATGQC